jgi:hypothetical protein
MATAKKKLSILEDPRYPDFVARYQNDPLRFAVEVCGFLPSYDQERLFQAIKPPTARVSVVSGTGTGKTSAYARIALWHLLCFPFVRYEGKVEVGSNTYIGAPVVTQVADGIWKEMTDCKIAIASGIHSWINDYYEIQTTSVFVKGYSAQWFIKQVALAKGQSVSIAGKHRYWQLIIIDEAAGVPEDHFNVIDGTQTQGGNRTLMASQGVRNAGRFYDSHHSLAKKNGGSWTSLRFSSERSPFVTQEWLKNIELQTGGRFTEEYQIRVLGRFVQSSGHVLLTRKDIEGAFEPKKIIGDDEAYGYVIYADVGAGEYRDESVVCVAKVVGYGDQGADAMRIEFLELPIISNTIDTIDFSGELVELFGKTINATIGVDAGGLGISVCQNLERKGVPVKRLNWGKPCFKKDYKERFFNQRACAMIRLRDAIRQGRVVLPQNLTKRMKEKVIDQGTRIPYHFSEAGGLRYVIESKEDMRKEGIKSPDIFDCLSFPFIEGMTYMPAGDNDLESVGDAAHVQQQAEELFDGIE